MQPSLFSVLREYQITISFLFLKEAIFVCILSNDLPEYIRIKKETLTQDIT